MRDFLVKIKPKTPFHIGEVGIGLEGSLPWVPSDLLFSAFANAYGLLYGRAEVEALLSSFLSSPPFLVSSAFPFFENKLFFPRPLITPKLEDTKRLKDLKKMRLIPEELFKKWLSGEEFSWETDSWDDELPRQELLPGVKLDRVNMKSQIYYRSAYFFPERGGLFFLLRLKEESLLNKIKGAFNLLGDIGIGGERSLGYGHFKVISFEETTLFPPPEADSPILTLSLVVPSPLDDVDLESSYYQLILRGGWVNSPFVSQQVRRKAVWMLAEGSVFSRNIRGSFLDLTPEGYPHKVYRYALTFPVGVILDAEGS
ncbi:type III-A CRISPR-associated RAMP protein Csm4 [bacterium]|nr:type III-A CRISPR-associated RAMP protein Csm4 [bacterium]